MKLFFRKCFYRGYGPSENVEGFNYNRLQIEFSYYVLVGDLIPFREKWCVGEIVCCIYEEQLVLNF